MNYGQFTDEKKGKGKLILVLALTLVLAAAAGGGFYFVWRSTGYLVTDNARVTTDLISIVPAMQGTLERFAIYEGKTVTENEILGWVENDDAMRSPVDGLVIHSSAVQGQMVSPMEPVAVIADTSKLHVQANIEETDILRVQLGQSVIVRIDPFGRRQFTGYISEIGQVTAAELTGTAMFFNTGGTFTRVTHLIPIKINIEDDINLAHLIGVNARVRIPLRPPVNNLQSVDTTVHSAQLPNSITVRGIVESVQRRNIYTTMGTKVERIHVKAGDRVRRGQILAKLDTADLTNEILNAQAALRIAEVNLAAAQHNHTTLKELYDAKVIPRNDLRQAEFQLQSAIASRQQAQAMLNASRTNNERSIIRAPINGTVTAVFAKEGEIGMGRMFVVEDTANLKITTGFNEHDISRIKTGMEVTITSNASGSAEYTGVINRINPAAIQSTSGEMTSASVAEFEAEVLVTSKNTNLRIGTNARVSVVFDD